ncbi:OLC1v1034199C1 [Oldenlandia corymbosa var. corymbosa]|uniref:OLC1v1034199C1 n=1 Tax=Oldenlandia corymbosa var. corymbosa TaxID=529605 RepID=A0AAV1CT10_OLDCO|nr:OLC1v1034199C1 [Oldenlandia corymbosa var. corymbosa]
MGCVSSKLFKREFQEEDDRNYPNHVVSLTSSTYGVLNLDKKNSTDKFQQTNQERVKDCVAAAAAAVIATDAKKLSPPRTEPPEVINAWELMQGLEEEAVPKVVLEKKSPKSRVYLYGFGEIDPRSPLKFLNQMASPRKPKRYGGKENNGGNGNVVNSSRSDYSPKTVLRASSLPGTTKKASPLLRSSARKASPNYEAKCDNLRVDSGVVLSRRRSLGPLFDPELVASFEKEMSEEKEHIKKMVSGTPNKLQNRKSQDSSAFLQQFEQKCPPGGENAVVIYTTTLRGIRKTFEDCNTARAVIESHQVQMFERDISMHSGFKHELRGLMGTKEVKVPLVFVKGRLIGGADEMVKLEEDGKLSILFSGIPKVASVCNGCAGFRFVMCMDCNGSCKVLDGSGKKTVKCAECNENGLVQCPFCS